MFFKKKKGTKTDQLRYRGCGWMLVLMNFLPLQSCSIFLVDLEFQPHCCQTVMAKIDYHWMFDTMDWNDLRSYQALWTQSRCFSMTNVSTAARKKSHYIQLTDHLLMALVLLCRLMGSWLLGFSRRRPFFFCFECFRHPIPQSC